MEFENTVFKAGNRFQNLVIKSESLKVIYFILMQIFTVRYISLLFLIPCQLFSQVQMGKYTMEHLGNIIIENQSESFILLLCIFIILIVVLYVAIFNKNELASKLGFISVLFVQQMSSIFGIIVISILFQGEINIILKLPSVLILLLVEAVSFMNDKVLISYSFDSRNLFAHKNNNLIAYCRLVEKLILYLTFMGSFIFEISSTLSKLYYLSIVLLQLLKIKQTIREKYFIDQVANFMEMFASIVSATVLLQTIAFELYPIQALKTNIYVLCPIVSIFACVSVYTYLSQKYLFIQNRTNQYFFRNVQQVCEKNETTNYLEAFYLLSKNTESEYYSLIVASIRKNHQYLCRKPKCYCYRADRVEHEKNSLLDGNAVFFKGYYQQILNYIDKQSKNNDVRFLRILYFKFKIFNNSVKISRELHKIKCSFFSNVQLAMGKKILENSIQSVYEKHSSNTNDHLRVELPMELNQTMITLEKIVFNDIYVKNKKWSNLGKSFCKTLDIEEEIEKEIINLHKYDEIYDSYKVTYKKSLAFNALSLFYFADVAFINKKIDDIEMNMRELRSSIKYREVISNKELAKHILDNRCCLLQIDLSCQESIKVNQLPVSNCTNNVKEIFKFDKEQFIGRRLQSLFPKFLVDVENKFFDNILNPNDETSNTSATDKFFIDKSGHVFQALINLKIVAQDQSIVLMMVVFQKETKNIMLLNNKGLIQNIGETFTTYFGRLYEGIPFSSFFYFDDEYEKLNFTEKFVKDKFIFINSLQLADDWISYLERIKTFMKRSKQITSSIQSHHQKATEKSFQTRKNELSIYDKQTCEFLRKQKRQLIRSKILTSGQIIRTRQTRNKTLTPSAITSILSVCLDYKSFSYQDFHFRVVVIDQVKKKKTPADQTQLTIKTFHQVGKKKKSRKYQGTLKDIQKVQDEKNLLQDLQNQEDIVNSVDLQEEIKKKQRQKQLIYQEASSVQSSVRTSSVSYFYFKFVETCFNLFKNPNSIVDRRLNKFTVGSLFVAWCLSFLIIGTYVVFNLGLYEIKDIFFADGAVSDNMQLNEFMYNRAMNFKQFKNDPEQLEHIKEAAFYERQYVFGLQASDLKNFASNETSMTKTKFYEYIKVPTMWRFVNESKSPLQLQSNQFLTYYYHLSREVEQNLLNGTKQSQQIVQNALQLMMINFPEMKRINHYNLFLYQHMSDESIALLRELVSILIVCHVVLSVILFLMYYSEKIFRRNQVIEGYAIYKVIPPKVVEFIANYYGFYCQQVQNQKDLTKYQTHFDRHSLYLPLDQTTMKTNKGFYVERKSFFTPAIWKMIALIVVLNISFGMMMLTIKNLFDPIELMMKNVNSLMDSENYLIEAYVDLKAKFIIEENFMNVQEDFFDQLLQSQQSTEVIFNRISVESLDLFSNYDETYKSDFIDLLINNTCDLTQGQVTPQQQQNCRTKLKLNYISNGVITGMNFFTRRIKSIINQLQKKFYSSKSAMNLITQSDRTYILDTLKSADFREIDQSMIFMFKMYQATQARIYESLEKAIISIMNTSYWIVVMEVAAVGLLYPLFLLFNFRKEKFELSQLYVSFLLIPTPLARLLKSFSSKIQNILEYDKTK